MLERELKVTQSATASPVTASHEGATQGTYSGQKVVGSADAPCTDLAGSAVTAQQLRAARIKREIHAATAVPIQHALMAVTEAACASLEEQLADATRINQV